MHRPLIVGFAASLRNARCRSGAHELVSQISDLPNREALDSFISEQAKIHLDAFVEAGRRDGKPFDELYAELKRNGGRNGLSNSEVALAAALWGAFSAGAEIAHVSLSDHFPADGSVQHLDDLKAALRSADGILISTPVYFGDRSSLSQRLLEIIRQDPALKRDLAGKVYGGLAVGAKRNGGQETTLIYQMLDFINLGLVAVGNDAETTSQYGGTVHAGDVGTAPKDSYGLGTSIGVGRRVANVSRLRALGQKAKLKDLPIAGIWKLQDKSGSIDTILDTFAQDFLNKARVDTIDLIDHSIRPCIACDFCPIAVGIDEEYRCIITTRADGFSSIHTRLQQSDILFPTAFSPVDGCGVDSVYQQFMERTRYLRRGDYVFSNFLVAPIVINEVGSAEHMDVRMVTSFMRHHTIIHKPILIWLDRGQILNAEAVRADIASALEIGRDYLCGRILDAQQKAGGLTYRPIGYVLAQAKDLETTTIDARMQTVADREARQIHAAQTRLLESDTL